MDMPCQKAIWYILPAIRRNIARSMVDMGRKRSEIAEKLGVTEAAVSQYIHGKRGYLELPENIQEEIRFTSNKIIEEKGTEMAIMKELCRICKLIQKDNLWKDV